MYVHMYMIILFYVIIWCSCGDQNGQILLYTYIIRPSGPIFVRTYICMLLNPSPPPRGATPRDPLQQYRLLCGHCHLFLCKKDLLEELTPQCVVLCTCDPLRAVRLTLVTVKLGSLSTCPTLLLDLFWASYVLCCRVVSFSF